MEEKYPHITGAYRPVWDGHLHVIDHRKPDIEGVCLPRYVAKRRVRQVDCRQHPCRCCEEKRGGYQFRWFCPSWSKFYNQVRREGSWEAPIGDHEAATAASLRFYWAVWFGPLAFAAPAPVAGLMQAAATTSCL